MRTRLCVFTDVHSIVRPRGLCWRPVFITDGHVCTKFKLSPVCSPLLSSLPSHAEKLLWRALNDPESHCAIICFISDSCWGEICCWLFEIKGKSPLDKSPLVQAVTKDCLALFFQKLSVCVYSSSENDVKYFFFTHLPLIKSDFFLLFLISIRKMQIKHC